MRTRRHVFVSLVLVLCTCRREEAARDVVPSGAEPQGEAETKSAPPPRPKREKTITPDDLVPIESLTLSFPAAVAEFRSAPVGKPKELFSAPHLELVGEGPLTPTRVMVRVKDGPEYEAATLEAHLIDLETGSVGKFEAASKWQIPHLGLTQVWIGDARELALLHAKDGHVVLIHEKLSDNAETWINPGLGDGWVFEQVPDHPEAPGRYAHWTDLRRPAPSPDRELPFAPWIADDTPASDGTRSYVPDVRLPDTRNPGAVNPVLVRSGDEEADGCPRAELLPDGGYRCVEWIQALGQGWRVGIQDERPVFSNVETNEVQYLALAEHCGPFSADAIPSTESYKYDAAGFTYDPPRMIFACERAKSEILWTPEVTVTIALAGEKRDRRYAWWTRDRSLRAYVIKRDEQVFHDEWIDLLAVRSVSTPVVADRTTPYGARSLLASREDAPGVLWSIDFARSSAEPVLRHRCTSVAAENGDDGAWLLGCENPARAILWTEVVRMADRVRFRLPAVKGTWGRRAWVADAGRRAVAIVRRGGKDVLQTWTLK